MGDLIHNQSIYEVYYMKLKCIFSCSMIKIHCPFSFLSQIFDFTKIISYTWSDFPIFQIKTGNFLKMEKNQAKTYRENLQIYLHYKMRAEHQMKTIPK